jgi:hypothetical protein
MGELGFPHRFLNELRGHLALAFAHPTRESFQAIHLILSQSNAHHMGHGFPFLLRVCTEMDFHGDESPF